MIIIGINGLGVLPSACLLKDGKLIAFAEEERFTRYKGSFGAMPSNAMKFCMDYAGLKLKDIDYIAFGWNCNIYRIYMPVFLAYKYISRSPKFQSSSNLASFLGEMVKYNPGNVRAKIFEMIRSAGLEGDIPPIEFIPHHLSHAASSFYLSGFDKSYILIIDGSGEDTCTSIYKGDGQEISFVSKIKIPDSIGWFYQSYTEFLGFTPNNHEGKLMGLAAYGKENKEISEKLDIVLQSKKNGKYRYNAKYSFLGKHNQGKVFSEELCELFGSPRNTKDEISEYHKDLAYAVQKKLEESVLNIVNWIIHRKDFDGNLCIAGGVALNCKMNGVIADLPEIKNFYVPSCPSDAGSAKGAGLVLAKRFGHNPLQKTEHAYWGPEYSDTEIEKFLEKCRINFTKPENLELEVAKLLTENYVIGWFNGRMESGSRALGARSILASPLKKDMKDIINLKVKNRENWRPFAASILWEEREKFVYSDADSPFMATAFMVRPEIVDKITSAVHVDNTTRPQFVKKEHNEKYWNIIKKFGDLTGVYAILNTSFNTNEEPIVENPMQAVKAFYGSGMDYLAIGSYLLKK